MKINIISLTLIFFIIFCNSCNIIDSAPIKYFELTKERSIDSFKNAEGEIELFISIKSMGLLEDRYTYLDGKRDAAYITDKDFTNFKQLTTFGEGPGEVQSIGSLSNSNPTTGEFIINDISTNKLLFYSKYGNFIKELKLPKFNLWDNKILFDNNHLLFSPIPPQLASAPKIVKLDLFGQVLQEIELSFPKELGGQELSILKINDVYISIAKSNFPSFAILNQAGEVINTGVISGHEIIENNIKISKTIRESYGSLNVSVGLFKDIYLSGERIFILVTEISEDQSSITNKVYELELIKDNLIIKNIFQLDLNEDYLCILVDEDKLLASSFRTGYIDEYVLPN